MKIAISSALALGLMSSPLMAQTVLMQKQGTDFAIDGNHGSSQELQQVYVWDTNLENVNQKWLEIDRGNGFYSYQKQSTSLCLDGGNGGENYQPVILYSCGEANFNQHWRKVSTGGRSYRLEKRNSPRFSIDGNHGAKQGQAIYLYSSDNDNVNQQWEFIASGSTQQPNSDSVTIPGTIQAEDFTAQAGVHTQATTDTNGGENIGFIEDGDYTEYQIYVPSSGTYTMETRVSSKNQGGTISVQADGSPVGSISVPATGGWQSWQTAASTVQLDAGNQTLRLTYNGDNGYLMNVNFLSLTSGGSRSTELVHPGGWHSQADLTLIREKVAAREEPWISAWDAIRGDSPNANYRTNVSRQITSNGAMSGAGFAAWVLTMKWVASGEQAYADAAIGIIDDWVETVRDFDVYGPTLTVSTGAGAMAQAAEVLEHGFNGEAGWPASKASAAKVWFKEVIYDRWTNTGDQRSSNWGTSALGGNMSMSIFMDDKEEFEYQRDAYLYGYKDTDDGCASLTDYIMYDSGQAFETGRDQAHVQGGIAHLTEAALSAWNQGVDLVSASNNRIRAGVEYHAKYNLGYDNLPFNTHIPNPCGIWNPGQDEGVSADERGNFSPVYYMSSKLFTLAGLDHPYTKEVLTSHGYSPEINNFAHPGLGTLVFQPE